MPDSSSHVGGTTSGDREKVVKRREVTLKENGGMTTDKNDRTYDDFIDQIDKSCESLSKPKHRQTQRPVCGVRNVSFDDNCIRNNNRNDKDASRSAASACTLNSTPSKTSVADTKSGIHANRTNMAILHFLMTAPKWSIGLFLFLAGSTRPIQNPTNAIRAPISQLQTLVEMEGRSYQTCIDHAWQQKQKQLKNVATIDRDRIMELHLMNQKTVLKAQDDVTTCLYKTRKARDLLVRLREDGMMLPWTVNVTVNDTETTETPYSRPSSSSCSVDDQQQMEALLGQDFRIVGDQVTNVMDDYVKDSERSLELVHTYALARFEYDYNYFVGARIQPALDWLASQQANLKLFQVSVQMDLNQLRNQIEETLHTLKLVLRQAKEHIDILSAKLEEFASVIDGFYVNYAEAYDRLRRVVKFINDAVPDIFELPSFLNIDNLPVPASLLPISFAWPRPNLDYDDIQHLINEATEAYLVILHSVLDNVRKLATIQLQDTMNEMLETLLGILELKDYNPPLFQGSFNGISNMAQELDFQGVRGKQVLNWTAEAINSIRVHVSNFTFNGDNLDGPNVTSIDYSYVEESTEFSYLGVILPNISLPDLLHRMASWIVSNTWILEILIQAYRLWRLEAMYIRGAIPQLPEIEYGDDDNKKDDEENFKAKYTILVFVLKSFFTPRIISFMIFLPVAIVAITFWFPHVHQSCVQSNDGTFLAKNFLSPLLINQANAWGNVQYLQTEFQCQQTQRQWCTEVATEADAQYQKDLTALHALQVQQDRSIDTLDLMGNCIDAKELTPMMQTACCGLKSYTTVISPGQTTCLAPIHHASNNTDHHHHNHPRLVCPIDLSTNPHSAYLPLETYLTEPSCGFRTDDEPMQQQPPMSSHNDWKLVDTRYNCSALVDVCHHIPCNGADEELIRQQTIITDCQVEMYAIDVCYFLLALFVHAITINVVFTLMFNGIRQVRWRTLCPDGIRFKTQLQENGRLAKGYDIHDRSERISKAVQRLEMMGKLQIGLGVVLLVVYAICALVLIV
jgi:hypothetical protein